MIDDPRSYRRETSLECFNTNFDRLQKIVNNMDDEIIATKTALKAAEKMRDRLGE